MLQLFASPARAVGLVSLASLLLHSTPAAAHPHPKDDLHDAGFGFIMPRDCAQYCGYDNQYCCGTGQECYTANDIAGCKNTAAGGGYNLYTTTWTLTETFTSTFSSIFPAATTSSSEACVPVEGSGQVACGSICCADWQYCAYDGQCAANAGWTAGTATATAAVTATAVATATATPAETRYTTYTTSGVVVTTSYEPAFRVTGSGTATGTGTAIAATGSSDSTTSSHKLSGGAIAGIVIGVIVGVALLIALCACVLVRGLWHGVMSLLGFNKRDDRSETVIVEEEYRHSAGVGRHGSWHGSHPQPPINEKRKSGGGWLGLGAAAGTLALLLGLRRKDHRETVERVERRQSVHTRSDISSGYYSYDDPSSRGGSRVSRGTRASRRSDPSRVSRSTRPSRLSRPSRSASRR